MIRIKNSTMSDKWIHTWGDPKKKTSLNAAERGEVGEGQRQCLFPTLSTVSSETDVFL